MELLSKLTSAVKDNLTAFLHLWVDLNLPPMKKDVEGTVAPSSANETTDGTGTATTFDRKLFECSTCGNIPEPPVYTCTFGHIVCGACRESLNICTEFECSGDFIGNLRNLVVENFVTCSVFPCKFKGDGCPAQCLGARELLKHQKFCFYRHVKCGIISSESAPSFCDGTWEGSVKDFYAHLTIAHQMQFVFRDRKTTLRAKFDLSSKRFLEFIEPAVFLKVKNSQNFVIRSVFNEAENSVFTFLVGFYRDLNDMQFGNFIGLGQGQGQISQAQNDANSDKSNRTIVALTLRKRAALLNSKFLAGGDGGGEATTKREHVWIGPSNTVYDSVKDILQEKNGLSIPWAELLEIGHVYKDTVMWELDVEIYADTGKGSSDQENGAAGKPRTAGNSKSAYTPFTNTLCRESLPRFLRPLFSSAWSIVAPTFTICIMLFFVFCV